MAQAVQNGANSVSIPDEYVTVAHFLCYQEKYAAPSSVQAYNDGLEAAASECDRDGDSWIGNSELSRAAQGTACRLAEYIRALKKTQEQQEAK